MVKTALISRPLVHSKALAGLTFKSSPYTHDDRINVALHYLVMGNVYKVSEVVGIPKTTIISWKKRPWWGELCAELCEEKALQFQAGFEDSIQIAQATVKDRLVNGDVKLVKNKEGDYVEKRVPVSMKDAGVITGIFFDKYRLSRGDPTTITKSAGPSDDELRRIANEEIDAARMKKVVSEQ